METAWLFLRFLDAVSYTHLVRLDHLLSKELDTVGRESGWINPTKREEEVENRNVFYCWVIKWLTYKKIRKSITDISGVDALRGNTRSHPEHDG